MFLISDKFDKLDSRYAAMKEDKDDLLKEEEGTTASTRKCKFHAWNIILLFFIMLLFGVSVWIMTVNNTGELRETSDAGKDAKKAATDVINETQTILSRIREKTSAMSEQNMKSAVDYVAAVRDALKLRAQRSVQKLNKMISDEIRRMENELTEFDAKVVGIESGLVDVFDKNVEARFAKIASSNVDSSANVADSLDGMIEAVETEMSDMLDNVERMYKSYGNDLADALENRTSNVTSRISVVLRAEAERGKPNDAGQNRVVDMCYTISAQNVQITDQLTALVRAIAAVINTRERVHELRLLSAANGPPPHHYSPTIFDDADTLLASAEKADREFLRSLVKDESNFLGSLVTKEILADDGQNTNKFVLDGLKTAIGSLAGSVKRTVGEFTVVKDRHLKTMVSRIEENLAKVGGDLKERAKLITATTARGAYAERASFEKSKAQMNDRFAKVSEEVNAIFENRKSKLQDILECTTKYIIENQVPRVADLSMNDYSPTDLCPTSTDYQKQISNTLDSLDEKINQRVANATGSSIGKDGTQATAYYNAKSPEERANSTGLLNADDVGTHKGNFFTDEFSKETQMVKVTTQRVFGNEVDTADDDSTANSSIRRIIPPFLFDTMQRIIKAFTKAGYQIEGPVEVYVIGEDK